MYKVGRSILERAYVEDANNELKDGIDVLLWVCIDHHIVAWTELM